MKNFIYKGISCLGIALTLVVSSCTDDFESKNTNPHQATEEMMLRDNLYTGSFFLQMQKNVLPIAQEGVCGDDVYQISQNLTGDIFSGYMGTCGYFYSNSNNATYSLIPDWYKVAFDRAYMGIMTSYNQLTKKTEENSMAYSMATVVKVAAMHRITDMYGPLPYVNFSDNNLKKSYDSQEDIYNKFFDELDAAITSMTGYVTKNPGAKYLADYDNVYFGNVENWVKFANTLRLRLAIRVSYANPTKAQEEAEKSISNSIGVMTSKSDVAALSHNRLSFNHPLFIISEQFNETRMGANMDSYLNGYNDPRVATYFNPSSDGSYQGVRNGIFMQSKATYSGDNFSKVQVKRSTPVMWMNPAEAYFLRAEGALRGWNMGGTAQSLYEEGIKVSFDYNDVAGNVAAYLNDDQSVPAAYTDPVNSSNSVKTGDSKLSTITIKWNESDNFEKKLERIITQKWIAMFPDGQEAWSEFRRTGYPKVFPVVINNSGGTINTNVQIRRLPFPVEEYKNNEEGVQAALQLLNGPDNGGTKLWWDAK